MAKATTKTTATAKTTSNKGNGNGIAHDLAVKPAGGDAAPGDGAVARRAYDLYLARGREDGHDVEDWLKAECELRAANGHA